MEIPNDVSNRVDVVGGRAHAMMIVDRFIIAVLFCETVLDETTVVIVTDHRALVVYAFDIGAVGAMRIIDCGELAVLFNESVNGKAGIVIIAHRGAVIVDALNECAVDS
jgi:hypothetical protein